MPTTALSAIVPRRLVEAGTRSLADSDHALLTDPDCPYRKFIHDAKVAVIFCVPQMDAFRREARGALAAFGLSDAFLALWDDAVSADAEFLMLDADA